MMNIKGFYHSTISCLLLTILVCTSASQLRGQSIGAGLGYRSIQRIDNGPNLSLHYKSDRWDLGIGTTFNPNFQILSSGNNISYSNNLRQSLSLTIDILYKIYNTPVHQFFVGLANGIAYRDFWTYGYIPIVKFTNTPEYVTPAGYTLINQVSPVSKNIRFSHHSLQLHSSHHVNTRLEFTQAIGFGFLFTPAFEYIDGDYEFIFPNFEVGVNYTWPINKSNSMGGLNSTQIALRNSISFSFSDGIISEGLLLKFNKYLRPFSNEIGLIINIPVIQNEKINRIYHQRGKIRNPIDLLGLQAGISVPFRLLGFTLAPFYSLEIKKQRLLTSWFEDTGIIIPDSIRWRSSVDNKLYAYYYYISEEPVVSFENFVGLSARFDLSEKVFIEERLGVGLGFYIHEFEDYFPGPKKHSEFVFPYFSLGLGYNL